MFRGTQERCPLCVLVHALFMTVGVVELVFDLAFAAFGIILRLAVSMRTIDDMRWNKFMCKAGHDLDPCYSGNEQTNKDIGRNGGGEAGAGEVLLRIGKHAIQGSEELIALAL